MKSKVLRHQYIRRMDREHRDNTFWGVKMEVLFRGFSKSDMFIVESEIRDLICRRKREIQKSGKLREISIERLDTVAFKDVLL
jgi:hypothetical protein